MNKNIVKTILVLTLAFQMNAQEKTFPLWEQKIPNSIENKSYTEESEYEKGEVKSTRKVSIPTLSYFPAPKEKATGTAVIIMPGGGYARLAMTKEGFKVAQWLNNLGITAFVLKSRLPEDLIMENKSIGPLQDAQEAMRYVRTNAQKYGIDPAKIGCMGFSAGGHLASTLATHFEDNVYNSKYNSSARPDFSMLIYPVISMDEKITHKGSRENLIGKNPTAELVQKYSNELQINSKTPPAILIHATDDKAVPVENSINYFLGLKRNNIQAEMHVYEKGGHGFGLGVTDTSQYWPKACEDWLRINKLIQ